MDVAVALSELWEAAKAASPFATMFATMLWFLERNERKSNSAKYDALFERTLAAMDKGSAAIEKFSEVLTRRRG